MSHTPTPFEETTLPGSGQYAIKCPRGLVASMEAGSDAVRKTDRAFIITACNAHDELVAALKLFIEECDKKASWDKVGGAYSSARAALAKAEDK